MFVKENPDRKKLHLCLSSFWLLKFVELLEYQESSFLIFTVAEGLNKIKKNWNEIK